nr:MAG TPA: hypothetical protein [Caudoviricetes sp.]
MFYHFIITKNILLSFINKQKQISFLLHFTFFYFFST